MVIPYALLRKIQTALDAGGAGGGGATLIVRQSGLVVPVSATQSAPLSLGSVPVSAGRAYRVSAQGRSASTSPTQQNIYLTWIGPASILGLMNMAPPASVTIVGTGASGPGVLQGLGFTDEPTADGTLELLAWLDSDGAGTPAVDPVTLTQISAVIENVG